MIAFTWQSYIESETHLSDEQVELASVRSSDDDAIEMLLGAAKSMSLRFFRHDATFKSASKEGPSETVSLKLTDGTALKEGGGSPWLI